MRYACCIAVMAMLLLVVVCPSPATGQVDQRCASGARVGDDECGPERYLMEVLRRDGVGGAMDALDQLAAADEEVRRDAHGYAHAIGLAAYTGASDVGEVFERCTPAYQSGCYHGVIQSYFAEQVDRRAGQLDPGLVNALCRDQREDSAERWLLFQCAHGMGHGLMMVENRDLPAALGGCDLVEFAWERQACYGGVFMENIVGVTVPHHAVGRPEMHGDADSREMPMAGAAHESHGGGTPSAMATREDFPALKRDEPLYPCSALPTRYSIACYEMQTSAILYFNGQDVAAAADVCTTAPELYRTTCFQSLGRDVSAITGQDHARAIRLCATAPDEFEPWCHLGYAKNLVDLTADADDGLTYCRLLPPGESKRVCYVGVGEEIWVLADALDRRAAMCSAAEADYVDACRHGAGLLQSSLRVPPSREPAPGRAGALR